MIALISISIIIVLLLAVGIYYMLGSFGLFAGPPPEQSPAQLNTQLFQPLGITADDLTYNRSGQLSPAQQQKLHNLAQQSNSTLGCSLVMVLGFVLLFGGFVVVGEGGELMAAVQRMPILGFIYAAIIGLFVLAGVGSTIYQYTTLRSLGEQKLYSIEGKVKLRVRYAKGTYYIVSVGRRTFHVTKEQYNGFVSGGTYRIYYIPYYTTYMLISAEAI